MKAKEKGLTKKILDLYMNNEYDLAMDIQVQRWLADPSREREKSDALGQLWDETIEPEMNPKEDTYKALRRFRANYMFSPRDNGRTQRRRIFLKIAAVLIPVVALGASVFMLFIGDKQTQESQFTEVSVPSNIQKQIVLPDSTIVWVKEGGVIAFNKDFSKERIVSLEGEAFFDVVSNKERPFVVETKNIRVKVLGTKFNLEAYKDSNEASVILSEGSVRVSVGEEERVMEERDKLTYNAVTREIEVVQVDVSGSDMWWNESLVLEHVTLYEVFEVLRESYGVEIQINTELPMDQFYSFELNKKDGLDSIIELIERFTGEFEAIREGDIVIVRAK